MPVGMASAPTQPMQVIPQQPVQVDSEPLDAEPLAMEIFARLVVTHLGREVRPPDPVLLAHLAQMARTSAQVYIQIVSNSSEDNHE